MTVEVCIYRKNAITSTSKYVVFHIDPNDYDKLPSQIETYITNEIANEDSRFYKVDKDFIGYYINDIG